VSRIHITGIDPGLVHTGVVSMMFDSGFRELVIESLVIEYAEFSNPDIIWDWLRPRHAPRHEVYVEKFVPRPGMNTSPAMLELEHLIKDSIPLAQMVRNMGVKQVITPQVMTKLNVWTFAKSTNHQDLRSAARIGLFGMSKDDDLNALLAELLMADVDGQPWNIVQK
jgi:hypothetical protein